MLPVKLEIDNFMSYDRATLEFDFNSALLSGKNGSGKSAIFNAIEWALWGEARHKNADSVVKRGQPSCRVAFFFKHDGKTYRIVRTRSVKQSKMEVEFDEIADNGLATPLSHDTNKATDAEIRRVLRSNHDVFINSSYFRQNSFFDFVEGTFGTRQAIIGSLLNLDKWNRYQKSAKETYGELSAKVDSLKLDLEKLSGLPTKLELTRKSIAETKLALEQMAAEETAMTEQLAALERKANESKDEAAEYSRYRELVARGESQKKSVATSELIIQERRVLAEKLKRDAEQGRVIAAELSAEIAAITEDLASRPVVDVAKIEESLILGRSEFKILNQQIENLMKNDKCQMCGHEWVDLQAKLAFLESLSAKKIPLEEKLKKAEPKLQAIKAKIEEAKQKDLALEKRQLRKAATEKAVEVAEAKRATLEAELDQLNEQLASLTKQLSETERLAEENRPSKQSHDFQSITTKIEGLKAAQRHLKKSASEANFNLGALVQEEKTLLAKLDEFERLSQQLAGLTREATVFAQLAKAFSKDGIQALIVDNIVEELTRISNYWLHQFTNEPVYIGFVTQKKNTKGDWRETFDIEIQTPTGLTHWEDFSGGEQFRIGFAIRLAFSTIQAKRMGGEIQLLMLDEVSTSLDTEGLEAFVAIIRRLEKEMKVMVITHDDKLKEEFDTIISISRNLDGSRID